MTKTKIRSKMEWIFHYVCIIQMKNIFYAIIYRNIKYFLPQFIKYD